MIDLEVTVHSQILRHGSPAVRLYYLLRALDVCGSGKGTFNVNDACSFLGISIRTLYNYIGNQTFFRRILKRGDVWTIYYASLENVVVGLKLEGLGACAKVFSQHVINHRILATEIVTEAQQQASEFMAVREWKKKEKTGSKGRSNLNIIKPEAFFQPSFGGTSDITAGVIEKKNGVLYVNEKFLAYGTSRAGVANKLAAPEFDGKKRTISTRTITKHLKTKEKLKVAQTCPEAFYLRQFAQFQDEENWTSTAQRFFRKGKLIFKSLCSLYHPEFCLTSKRYQKSKVRKRLASLGELVGSL